MIRPEPAIAALPPVCNPRPGHGSRQFHRVRDTECGSAASAKRTPQPPVRHTGPVPRVATRRGRRGWAGCPGGYDTVKSALSAWRNSSTDKVYALAIRVHKFGRDCRDGPAEDQIESPGRKFTLAQWFLRAHRAVLRRWRRLGVCGPMDTNSTPRALFRLDVRCSIEPLAGIRNPAGDLNFGGAPPFGYYD